MKLSKRLLAIVLAAALLLGTVIIAAYADDDWTTIATTQADTKLAYTLTAPGLTAASGSSALQVKAGDTIDVYVQFRSNCYVCYPGGEAFFYTTALFNKINKADVEGR